MRVYSNVGKIDVQKRNGKVIITRWIDTDKGQDVYRSRLVGREIQQDKRQDLFSPTPPLETMKLLVAHCAKSQNGSKPKRIAVCDVSRAYFYAKCRRLLHINIPLEDWEVGDENHIAKLNLGLYGTRDAAQNSTETYTRRLGELGFKAGVASPCSFVHEEK